MGKRCRRCNEALVLEIMPDNHMHYGKWLCSNAKCRLFHGWESKPKNKDKQNRNDNNNTWRRMWQERGVFVCGFCGLTQNTLSESSQWQLDHIVPLSLGGEDAFNNTMMLCRYCHTIKNSMHYRTKATLNRGNSTMEAPEKGVHVEAKIPLRAASDKLTS